MTLVVFVETGDVARSHGGPVVHLRRKLRVYVTAYVGGVVSDADFEGGSPKTFYGDLDS
jgi:hypothetical protein